MNFISNHVFKSLIKYWTTENITFDVLTWSSRNKSILSIIWKSIFYQYFWHLFEFLTSKSCSIFKTSIKSSSFRCNKFKQFSNSHSWRITMRIHDQIWSPSCFWEWHVFFIHYQSANTFLTMTTWEFIAKFRPSRLSEYCFDNFRWLFISGYNDFVDMIIYTGWLKYRRLIIPWYLSAINPNNFYLVFDLLGNNRHFLIDEDITILNGMSDFSQSILIKTFVFFNDELTVDIFSTWFIHSLKLLSSPHQIITDTDVIVSFELSFISSEIKGSSKTSIHWCLVDNNSIFNIITTVRHDSDTCIVTCREFVIIDKLDMCCFSHWLLRIN